MDPSENKNFCQSILLTIVIIEELNFECLPNFSYSFLSSSAILLPCTLEWVKGSCNIFLIWCPFIHIFLHFQHSFIWFSIQLQILYFRLSIIRILLCYVPINFQPSLVILLYQLSSHIFQVLCY